VVGRGLVVVRGLAQEPVALGEGLEHAAADDGALLLRLPLQDLEDDVLLAKVARDVETTDAGAIVQLGDLCVLELREVHRRHVGVAGRDEALLRALLRAGTTAAAAATSSAGAVATTIAIAVVGVGLDLLFAHA